MLVIISIRRMTATHIHVIFLEDRSAVVPGTRVGMAVTPVVEGRTIHQSADRSEGSVATGSGFLRSRLQAEASGGRGLGGRTTRTWRPIAQGTTSRADLVVDIGSPHISRTRNSRGRTIVEIRRLLRSGVQIVNIYCREDTVIVRDAGVGDDPGAAC